MSICLSQEIIYVSLEMYFVTFRHNLSHWDNDREIVVTVQKIIKLKSLQKIIIFTQIIHYNNSLSRGGSTWSLYYSYYYYYFYFNHYLN